MPLQKTKSVTILAGILAVFLALEGGLRLKETAQGPLSSGKILLLGGASPLARLGQWGSFTPVGAGQPGENSAELLARLPALLSRERPRVLVVMAGESNFWNRRLVANFLDDHPRPFAFLSHWKTMALFRARESESSRRFSETPVSEYPTLAMRWVGYLRSGPAVLEPAEAAEAHAALERWLKDPRAQDLHLARQILAGLDGGPPPREENLFFLAERLAKQGNAAKAEQLLQRGLRENPFYAGGMPPLFQFFPNLGAERFSRLLSEAFPPPAAGVGEKPALGLLRASFLSLDDVNAWVFHDLRAIVHLARDRGIPVMLQTYPTERFSARDHAVDLVIREAAARLGVPLSDTSRELSRRWTGRALPEFYEPQSDTLNADGNALVGKILLEDLRRAGLIEI
ncbi:MAG: hypothetical protein ACXWSD_03325 [Bdellovibrionota bacterium]